MTGHGCEEADGCMFADECPHLTSCRIADDGLGELTAVCREELTDLWYDLNEARRTAQNGRWSIQCEYIQGRIEKLTKLVGPTSWESIQIGLIEDGLYQKINRDLGFEVQPDMARVAEVRAGISRHPFRQQEGS